MKINELLNEAPPGTSQPATSWLGKKIEKFAGIKSDFDMKRAVSKAYKFWIDHVGKMEAGGYDMTNEENYLKELSRWMHVRLHIPTNSKILSDMINYLKANGTTEQTLYNSMFNALKSASTSTERGNRYSTRNAADMQKLTKDIIPIIAPMLSGLPKPAQAQLINFVLAKVVADNTINDPAEIVKLAQDFIAKSSSTPTGSPSIGTQKTSKNGNTYTWDGSKWKNNASGAVAGPKTTAELNGTTP